MEAPLPELDMSSALTLLGDAVTGQVLETLRGTGLRPGHGYLIQRLLAGPATATEIAEELGITQQAVSKVLKELAALGHVEPAVDPANRRRRPVALTATGRNAVEATRRTRAEIDARLREALTPEGFDTTMAALNVALETLGLGERVRRRTVQPPGGTM
ncbi:hypothetical protein Kisp01_41210 [Kineosporia sp. NBRC 101677]|uniref:MarR family winged helix-turn-helix transcriptional regulator n=1 Tax=Kineosporia sp. NBRC 101677 TaxID=3032197 RepID=UPI00249FBCFF|nr:MarR family winged helix-turn-helix transcriptional regulator [Kineosporia sp. NBRC 101677]GLY17106.1 hypothetical protein Kisp01_41210 [Kineosporia sp. NBRC 101677]